MKTYPRLQTFRTQIDDTSAYLSQFRFDIDIFTDWPSQDHKTMRDLVGSRIKLILHERGECELTGQDARFTLKPGCVVLIPPYVVHNAKTGENVHSYELFFNVYPITREQEFLLHTNLDRLQVFEDVLLPSDFDALAACYRAQQEKLPGTYAALNAELTMILLRLIHTQGSREQAAETNPTDQRIVERMLVYLSGHIAEPVRVEHLCEALGISQSYLYRCCRSAMGCSPSQLITRYKLRRARDLLRDPDLTVGDVAAAIGYDPYYFSAQFKKNLLMSPSDYRKKLKL